MFTGVLGNFLGRERENCGYYREFRIKLLEPKMGASYVELVETEGGSGVCGLEYSLGVQEMLV